MTVHRNENLGCLEGTYPAGEEQKESVVRGQNAAVSRLSTSLSLLFPPHGGD